jgi:RNA polymerase sigma-70 factor (ECF subfamily)
MATDDDVGVLLDIRLFEKFFRKHYTSFCLLAYRYLNDKDMAQEIVQDVFVRIWERRNQLTVKGSLTAYFYLAIKNTCINFLKHKKIEAFFARDFIQNHPAEAVDDSWNEELAAKIAQAIELLPPQRKKIFLMSRNEGMKYQQIAEALNISVKTVEAQMGLALKQLRTQLKDYLE